MYTDDLAIKYLKEFFPRLIDRIQDIERRLAALEGPQVVAPDGKDTFEQGPLFIDLAALRVSWKGERVGLTATELRIVLLLAGGKGRCWTRDEILQRVGVPDEADDRTVDGHVKRIRKKFRKVDPKFFCLKTYYRVGYFWDA